MPEAHEDVSSVVVLGPLATRILQTAALHDMGSVQLRKDAVKRRARTAGGGERYPGELGDRWTF